MEEPETLWFLLMDSLFSFKMGGTKRRKKINKDFEEFVKRRIIMLLESMSNHIPLPRILKQLTIKNADTDYKEFKPLFRRMLNSYFCHETILERANSLMRIDKLAFISSLLAKRVSSLTHTGQRGVSPQRKAGQAAAAPSPEEEEQSQTQTKPNHTGDL